MEPVLEGMREYISSAPREGEAARTIGPILAEMCAVSRPVGEPSHRSRRQPPRTDLVGVGEEDVHPEGRARLRAIRGRAGVHALVYLAKHRFACPGLDPYDFAASPTDGVHSPRLAHAIDSLGAVEVPGGMGWDADGRFAGLVREHGDDGEWLSIAALLCMMDDAARTRGDPPDSGDLLDEACIECGTFTRSRMSAVYGDLCRLGLLGQEAPGSRP